MTQEWIGFPQAVSAVSPLGESIDGSRAPRRARRIADRRPAADRSLTFFCSNPQCDHATWSAVDQARHMAREFWWLAQIVVRLAPDSPEALRFSGGTVLRDLTDEQLRDALADYEYLRRRGRQDEASIATQLRVQEYRRRGRAGLLVPNGRRGPRKLKEVCKHGHPLSGDNLYVKPDGRRECRECHRQHARKTGARYRQSAKGKLADRRRKDRQRAADPEGFKAAQNERMRQYRLRKKAASAAAAEVVTR